MNIHTNGKFLYKYRAIHCRAHYIGNIDPDGVMSSRFSPGSHFEMRFISFAVL